jgi:uncharacterized membrane protein YccC
MKIRNQFRFRAVIRLALLMLYAASAFAQDDNAPHSAEIPNPMGIHTWFIIVAVGALLAWSISYSLQMQKEALKRRTSREGLLRRKESYLDEIAELESRKEAGTISESQFRRQFNNTKIRLAKVLEQIEQTREASQ